MTGLRLAPVLKKTAVVLCGLLSSLLAFHTPSLAIPFAGYGASTLLGVGGANGLVFGPGTSFTVPGPGTTDRANVFFDPSGVRFEVGAEGATCCTPSFVTSLAFASVVGALTGPRTIELPIHFFPTVGGGIQGPFAPTIASATVQASTKFSILVDGVEVAGDSLSGTLSEEGSFFFDPPSTVPPLSLSVGPGVHSLLITAQADGFVDLSPVPEPTTLLLFGTTAAGLGLAARRRRRQNR